MRTAHDLSPLTFVSHFLRGIQGRITQCLRASFEFGIAPQLSGSLVTSPESHSAVIRTAKKLSRRRRRKKRGKEGFATQGRWPHSNLSYTRLECVRGGLRKRIQREDDRWLRARRPNRRDARFPDRMRFASIQRCGRHAREKRALPGGRPRRRQFTWFRFVFAATAS